VKLATFWQEGKLCLRYVEHFLVKKRVSPVANKVELPPSLDGVTYSMFHNCGSHTRSIGHHKFCANLTYKEFLVQILDHKEQLLRTKVIPLVKVL
jgi:hypothetical protein